MWKWQAEGTAKATVVLIHSAYEQHLRYAWQIEKWRAAGFDVYMADLPGHGKNAGADKVHRESFDVYEQAVHDMLKLSSENDLPVFVIAHGLGATITMNVLGNRKFNVAGAIFTSPWLQLKKLPPKAPNSFPGVAQLTGRRKMDHEIALRDLTRSQFSLEQGAENNLYHTVVTAAWFKELQSYMKETAAAVEVYPQIPTYLHTAERDAITEKETARQWLLKQQLTEFSYKEWKFCYHDIFQEPEKEEVFLAAQGFIHTVLRSVGYLIKE